MDDLIEARWANISLFYFKLSPIYSIVKEWHCQGSPKTWKGKEIQKLKASIKSIVFQMMINCFNNKPQTARVIYRWFWGLLQSVCWTFLWLITPQLTSQKEVVTLFWVLYYIKKSKLKHFLHETNICSLSLKLSNHCVVRCVHYPANQFVFGGINLGVLKSNKNQLLIVADRFWLSLTVFKMRVLSSLSISWLY